MYQEKVERFGLLMIDKLIKKGREKTIYWWDLTNRNLMGKLQTRANRLDQAVRHGTKAEQIKQAVNVANYAMMIADNAQSTSEGTD